jgi:hypothetical protein
MGSDELSLFAARHIVDRHFFNHSESNAIGELSGTSFSGRNGKKRKTHQISL